MEGRPFYSDWLRALLDRRAAFEAPGLKSRIDGKTGLPMREIIPYDCNQEQAAVVNDDGTVSVLCIGCAQPTPYMDIVTTARRARKAGSTAVAVGKIRVGAIVQFAVEEPCNERDGHYIISAVRRWRMKSVSKAGFGCPACVELFMDEEHRIATENASKQALFDAMTEVYMMKGQIDKLAALQQPKLFTPFLDILVGEISTAQERAL